MELALQLISKIDNIKEKITNKEYVDICDLLKKLSSMNITKKRYSFKLRYFKANPVYEKMDGVTYFEGIMLKPHDITFVSTFKDQEKSNFDFSDEIKQLIEGDTVTIRRYNLSEIINISLNNIKQDIQYTDTEFNHVSTLHSLEIDITHVIMSCSEHKED
jgi:hypothetical protein